MGSTKMFSEVAEEYLATPSKKYGRDKPATAHIRINRMIAAWRVKRIDQIDRQTVERFFVPLKKSGITGATFNTYVTYYRAVMHFARDEKGLIDFVPAVKRMPETQRTTYLEPYEIDRLVQVLDPLRADMVKFEDCA